MKFLFQNIIDGIPAWSKSDYALVTLKVSLSAF